MNFYQSKVEEEPMINVTPKINLHMIMRINSKTIPQHQKRKKGTRVKVVIILKVKLDLRKIINLFSMNSIHFTNKNKGTKFLQD